MELEFYKKEILENYKHIKKLEEVIPLKKAEIELELWNSIKEKLLEKISEAKSFDFIENSSEYLLQNHVDLLSFELENLKTYYNEPVYLGIGRYLKENGIYFFISDDFLNSKNKKYTSFLNKLKDNEKLKEWHSNSRNLYTDFKKNADLINLFNPEYEDFYNLLEKENFDNIVNAVVNLFYEEYKKLSILEL